MPNPAQPASGCGGTATGFGVNSFTTGAIAGNGTVTASFAELPPALVPPLSQWILLLLALLVLGVASRRLRDA